MAAEHDAQTFWEEEIVKVLSCNVPFHPSSQQNLSIDGERVILIDFRSDTFSQFCIFSIPHVTFCCIFALKLKHEK